MNQLNIGDPAPDLTLINAEGQPIQLGQLYTGRKTLVSFLRHFGCPFCREWLAQLEEHHSQLQAAGVQVVAVAMGEPKHVKRYCGNLAPHVDCLTGNEQGRDAYDAYGLIRAGAKEFLSFNVLKAGIRAFSKGKAMGQIIGDPLMLSGSFIIDENGHITWAYYAQYPGDHPAFETILQSL